MINGSLFLSIIVIHLLAVISPGPDFLLIIRSALLYSRKAGIFTAIGIGLGISIHIAISIGGLALIISKSILLYSIIKYTGAIYLLFLGFQSFVKKGADSKIKTEKPTYYITPIGSLKQGFLTNILNPKASLFFLSLYSYIIGSHPNSVTLYTISFTLILNTILWFICVSYFFTQKNIRQLYYKYQARLSKVLGGFLILLGLKIIISK